MGYRWRSRSVERKLSGVRPTGLRRGTQDAGFQRDPTDFANRIRVIPVGVGSTRA